MLHKTSKNDLLATVLNNAHALPIQHIYVIYFVIRKLTKSCKKNHRFRSLCGFKAMESARMLETCSVL